jgi:hypothetical protein
LVVNSQEEKDILDVSGKLNETDEDDFVDTGDVSGQKQKNATEKRTRIDTLVDVALGVVPIRAFAPVDGGSKEGYREVETSVYKRQKITNEDILKNPIENEENESQSIDKGLNIEESLYEQMGGGYQDTGFGEEFGECQYHVEENKHLGDNVDDLKNSYSEKIKEQLKKMNSFWSDAFKEYKEKYSVVEKSHNKYMEAYDLECKKNAEERKTWETIRCDLERRYNELNVNYIQQCKHGEELKNSLSERFEKEQKLLE